MTTPHSTPPRPGQAPPQPVSQPAHDAAFQAPQAPAAPSQAAPQQPPHAPLQQPHQPQAAPPQAGIAPAAPPQAPQQVPQQAPQWPRQPQQAPQQGASGQAPHTAPHPAAPQQAPPQHTPHQAAAHQAGQAGQQAPPQQAGDPRQAAASQPAPAQDAAGTGYSSPMPFRRTHLGHALASEWTKIRSVRSTMWTLLLTVVLTVGVAIPVGLAMKSDDVLRDPPLSGGFLGLMFGQLCIITLGVLVITSEYGTGMIRTTFTACPQRGRVLLAKVLVFFTVAFTVTLAACGMAGLILDSMLSDLPVVEEPGGQELEATGGVWLGATVGAALYVSLLGVLGLAVGALLRHSAGAITTMIGLVLIPLIAAMFMAADSLHTVRDKLIEYSPLNGLASLYRVPLQGADDATGWPLLGLLATVTLATLVCAFARINATDA